MSWILKKKKNFFFKGHISTNSQGIALIKGEQHDIIDTIAYAALHAPNLSIRG